MTARTQTGRFMTDKRFAPSPEMTRLSRDGPYFTCCLVRFRSRMDRV